MPEVQSHGFIFEKWVRNTFFGGYTGSYMQKWDIPAEANLSEVVPVSYRNLPVSVKTAKYGSPIGLGDVLRQRQIDLPFLMIVGFWRQRTSNEKWFEEIGVAKFTPVIWDKLWGSLTMEQIKMIDSKIKNVGLPYSDARVAAKLWKKDWFFSSGSELVINPKIDSKSQRRIQCSLPFSTFWKLVGRTPSPTDAPTLFTMPFENPVLSSARTFNRD